MNQPYQIMPLLSHEDLESLEASIKLHGVLVAVEYVELGNILDGHHRVAICEKLGIRDWPKTIRSGLSEEQKRTVARQLNIARRHLSGNQKRLIIAQQLAEQPSSSDRSIASSLGVDHKTVGSERRRLTTLGLIPSAPEVVGLDGIKQPYSRTRSLDPWQELKLSFISSIGEVRWYELSAILREMERDVAILKDIQAHCVPDDNQFPVRDVLPLAVANKIFDTHQPSFVKDGGKV